LYILFILISNNIKSLFIIFFNLIKKEKFITALLLINIFIFIYFSLPLIVVSYLIILIFLIANLFHHDYYTIYLISLQNKIFLFLSLIGIIIFAFNSLFNVCYLNLFDLINNNINFIMNYTAIMEFNIDINILTFNKVDIVSISNLYNNDILSNVNLY
jgi:hypothetical protein